jgi:predicted dehydrogenase
MKVGLVGLGRGGLRLAEALLTSSWCELVAVADSEPQRIAAFAETHPKLTAHRDFRSLVVSTPLDALFLAVPPFMRGNMLTLCVERRLPVWILTPAGRSFEETHQWAERFESVNCPCVIAREWGIEPALDPEHIDLDSIGRLFFARGHTSLCLDQDLGWRSDSHRAGGGVILYRAYPLIDMLIQAAGLPKVIYVNVADSASTPGRLASDTESTAALTMQFSGASAAVITASWATGPTEWSLTLYGAAGSVHIDETNVTTRDRTGDDQRPAYPRSKHPLLPAVEEFIRSLRSGARVQSTLREHLNTMAVIEAAYLSLRTGQPESPNQIFRLHRVTPSASS